MNIDERDARLNAAVTLAHGIDQSDPDREHEIAKLRKYAGTASRLYRPGWRFWNWLFDTEYVSVGMPPIAWLAIIGMWAGWGVLAALVLA